MSELTYVGNGVYRERRYLDKQPEVGDKIEIVRVNIYGSDFEVGNEGVITSIKSPTGNVITATLFRSTDSLTFISDGYYVIYEDIYRKLSHIDVEVKRFFGIPIGKKVTYVWKEDTV